MQIQSLEQNKFQQQNTQFKGAVSSSLRYLATNQAIGANLTDLSFMVIPRVWTDTKRNPDACLETARREASGTINHSSIGLYGAAGGALLSGIMGINKKFNIKANSMFTAPETLNILAENKAKQVKDNLQQIDYLKETLSNVKAYNPTAQNADKEGFVKLSQETIDDIAHLIDKSLKDETMTSKKWAKKGASNSLQVLINKIIAATGAESKYILESSDKKIISETNLKTLLEDIYKISDSFNKKDVLKTFEEQVKNGKPVNENEFVKKFSKFMKNRSLIGFLIGTGIGMSIQPINIYLTKRKTGSDGFVGVEGRSKDDSTGFKILKGLASAGFMGLTLITLNTGLKGFMSKMSFKGKLPTISQLKGIYGLTIISRLIAARDKDELRESLTKDTLGFLSWLVLGDFVNRIVAEIFDKSVMNRTKDIAEKKNFFKRIYKSKLKTRDEILIETLSQNNIDSVKKDGDKIIAKTFKELMNDLKTLPEQTRKITKKRLNTLNGAQIAGYLFSGLILGIGIPNLNIYITNKLDQKRKAKQLETLNAN